MSDESAVGEGKVDAAVIETEARDMGWVPEADFKGEKSRWVDAATFVEKGRLVLPIMAENNKRLQRQLQETRSEVGGLKETLRATQATIRALQDSHEEDVKERVAQAREDLIAQIAQAKKDGDFVSETKAQEQLTNLNIAARESKQNERKDDKEEKAATTQTGTAEPGPEYKKWAAGNPWFQQDKKKTAIAFGAAMVLKQEEPTLVGEAFYTKLDERLVETFGDEPRRGFDKVEGGGRGGTGGGAGGGKSYADLPPEAKAACDKMNARVVGAGRAHKDVISWRKSYCAQYFSE